MPDSQVAHRPKHEKKSRRRLRWLSPRRLFMGIALVATTLVTYFTWSLSGLPFVWSYLIGINLITFLYYFYDKSVAKVGMLRVPEFVLHLVTCIGGTPAAFLGQNLFRHKTVKGSFRRMFWLIVVGQLIVFGVWIYLTREQS